MIEGRKSTPLHTYSGDVRAVDTDLVIAAAFEEQSAALSAWSAPTAGEIDRAIGSGEFTGKLYEIFLTPIADRSYRAGRFAAAGLGRRSDFTAERVRRLASAIGLTARRRRISRVAVIADGPLDSPVMLQAIAEGLSLAEFDAGHYKTGGDERFDLSALAVVVNDASRAAAQEAVYRGRIIGEYCNVARRLANEPGNVLTPPVFVERLLDVARGGGLAAEVLEREALERLGMGLLLGVGRGSAEPPRLVVLRYEPAEAAPGPVLGLVGKGVTFDTGGISIKPAAEMDRMKDDMSGGAAVACAMRAMAELRAPVRAVGVIPIAENMPGGSATRPGDVLTGASGKTVEVINTDAEGRLMLGDALWYVRQLGATHLVDIATLTGAISVALGRITSGLFGTPPGFVEHVRSTAERAGDRCWVLPLFEEYRDQLRSEIADLLNTGGRVAGAITAAVFLREFTGGLPWAHIDIAGTAWNDEHKPFMPKGPTGAGMRTLVELAFTAENWKEF